MSAAPDTTEAVAAVLRKMGAHPHHVGLARAAIHADRQELIKHGFVVVRLRESLERPGLWEICND